MKKRIVCFGDSNTWGYNGDNGTRFPEDVRWTGVLSELLGPEYTIIEEGQNGRTIMNDDPWEGQKKGNDYIIPCVESQMPFDLLIIMLGSNDLKPKFSLPALDIAGGLCNMIEKIKGFLTYHNDGTVPKILIVAPVNISEDIKNAAFADCFLRKDLISESQKLSEYYKIVASRYDCDFLDANTVCKVGKSDGVHMTAASHKALAAYIYEYVNKTFSAGN